MALFYLVPVSEKMTNITAKIVQGLGFRVGQNRLADISLHTFWDSGSATQGLQRTDAANPRSHMKLLTNISTTYERTYEYLSGQTENRGFNIQGRGSASLTCSTRKNQSREVKNALRDSAVLMLGTEA